MFASSKSARPQHNFLLQDIQTNQWRFSAVQQQSFSILQEMFANWALTH
jgi:hypothetical protein